MIQNCQTFFTLKNAD